MSCDEFSAETYTVTFANGTTSEILPINITDDGIYEGDESFTLEIQDGLQDLVSLGTTRTATVVIEEDEESKILNFEYSVLSYNILMIKLHTYVLYARSVGGSGYV